MKTLPQCFNTTAQDSNPGSLSREFEAVPLSHWVLYHPVGFETVTTCCNAHYLGAGTLELPLALT